MLKFFCWAFRHPWHTGILVTSDRQFGSLYLYTCPCGKERTVLNTRSPQQTKTKETSNVNRT